MRHSSEFLSRPTWTNLELERDAHTTGIITRECEHLAHDFICLFSNARFLIECHALPKNCT
jgi:hypothetical protein